MAYGDLALIAAALRNRGSNTEWDWYARTDDPPLPAELTPGNATRVLSRCAFYRGSAPLTPTTSRQVNIDFEESAAASRGTGDDLTSAFEQNGGVIITLSDGKSLMLGSPASAGDVTDHYSWTVDADETEFDHAAFDAMYDALRASVTAGTPLSGTMRVHDGADPTGPATDSTPPTVSSRAVDGDALVITCDEALDTASVPAASAFAVQVAGAARAVSAVAIAGSTITLTLASAVTAGQAVTVAYTAPATDPVQDEAGNHLATFAAASVTNDTVAPQQLPYTLDLAHVSGEGGAGFNNNWWFGTIPAGRLASSTADKRLWVNTFHFALGNAYQITFRIADPANQLPTDESDATRYDLAGALEDAELSVQSADGATTYVKLTLSDRDTSEPYGPFNIPADASATLEALQAGIRLEWSAGELIEGVGKATFQAASAAALTRTAPAERRIAGVGSATFQTAAAATLTRIQARRVAGQGAAAFRAPGAATLTRTAPAERHIVGTGAATFRAPAPAVLSRTAPTPVRFDGAGAALFRAPAAAVLSVITGSREFDFDISAISSGANGFTTIGSTADTDDQRALPTILRGDTAELDYLQIRWNATRPDRRDIRINFAGTDPGRFTEDIERTALLQFEGPPGTPLATWRGADLGAWWDADNNRYRIDISDDDDFPTAGGGQQLNAAIRALGVGGTVRLAIVEATRFAGVGPATFRAAPAAALTRTAPAGVAFAGTGAATFRAASAAALTLTAPTERRLAGTGAAAFRAPSAAALTLTAPTARRITGLGSATFRGAAAAALSRSRPTGIGFAGLGSASFRAPAAAALSRTRPTGIAFTGLGSATFRAPAPAALTVQAPILISGLGAASFRTPAAATLTVIPAAHNRIWPADLPRVMLARGFLQTYDNNALPFRVDQGRPLRRRRYTKAVKQTRVIMPMTGTQWAALKTFYNETMDGGRLTIFFPDPLRPDTAFIEVGFVAPPTRVRRGGRWDVTLRLRSLE